MSKRPEVNPDRVKWDNEAAKKKLTRKHKLQKLAWMKAHYQSSLNWHKRRQQDLDNQLLKINQYEIEIENMD